MNATTYLETLTTLDTGQQQTVDPRAVQLLPNRRVVVDGATLELSDIARRCFDRWFDYPAAALNRRITADTELRILGDLHRNWLSKRANPEAKWKINISGNRVLSVRDATKANIDFQTLAQVLLEFDSPRYPLAEARVCSPTKNPFELSDELDLRFVFDVAAAEPRTGDVVTGGLRIRSSNSGATPLVVTNYLERLVCTNGMTSVICREASKEGTKARIRRRSAGNIDSMIDRAREVIALGYEQLQGKLKAFETLAQTAVTDIEHVIKEIALLHRLSKKAAEQLRRALTQDETGAHGNTSFDVINAVSRVATHGAVTRNVAERLSELAGAASASSFHVCPSCRRVLHPCLN